MSRSSSPVKTSANGSLRARSVISVLVGIVLIAVLAVGTRWALQSSESPPSADPSDERIPVVALGHVDVPGGVRALMPAQSGRITELPVGEGAVVEPDTVVIRLDDSLARAQLAEAEAAVDAAELAVKKAKEAPLHHQFKIDQQKAAVEAMTKRVAAARRLLEHREKLKSLNQPITEELLEAARAQVLEAEALETVERSRLDELKKTDPTLAIDVAEAELEVVQRKADLAREALSHYKCRAPARGRILRVNAAVGELTGPQAPKPPIIFALDVPLIVRAEVEQEFLNKVVVGMSARVEDHVQMNAPVLSGKVVRISDWIARRRSILFEPGELNDVRTAECLIELTSDTSGLRIGQRMRVILNPQVE